MLRYTNENSHKGDYYGTIRFAYEEEYQKIRACVLYPLLIEVVNKNRSQLQFDHMPLKTLYITATDVLRDRIIADYVRIKKELKAADIKLIEQPDTRTTLNCEYICRGYHEQFSLMKDHAKAVLSVMLGKYVGEIGKELNANSYEVNLYTKTTLNG